MFRYLYSKLEPLSVEYMLFDPDRVVYKLGTTYTDHTEMEVSALLESFLIHTRVLLDFFCYQKREKDNILASDFVEEWRRRDRSECRYLCANLERLNKSLAHLAQRRVHYDQTENEWEISEIYSEVMKLLDEFMAHLTPEQKRWF